jgi:hypothetical protein
MTKAINTTLTVSQLNSVGKPDDAVFRQTLNRDTKRWNAPKRRGKDGNWRTIKNKELVKDATNLNNPYIFALWKVKDIMSRVQYSDGTRVWKCSTIKKFRGRPGYTVMYLHCKRIKNSMHGGTSC